MESIFTQIINGIGRALLDVVTFPWWWYVRGLRRMLGWAGRTLRGWERVVGLRVWSHNLFVPMFGQTDLSSRLISFMMRLVVLMGRTLQVVVGALAVSVVILAYAALPIAAFWLIIAPIAR